MSILRMLKQISRSRNSNEFGHVLDARKVTNGMGGPIAELPQFYFPS
jgi:hypothetical protein